MGISYPTGRILNSIQIVLSILIAGGRGVFERSESRFERLPSLGRIELDTLDLEPYR